MECFYHINLDLPYLKSINVIKTFQYQSRYRHNDCIKKIGVQKKLVTNVKEAVNEARDNNLLQYF